MKRPKYEKADINAPGLQHGDLFTIGGFGKSARGHKVIGSRSAKTGRKMKVKTHTVYVVTSTKVSNVTPAIVEPNEKP